jgi:hypothetical protein
MFNPFDLSGKFTGVRIPRYTAPSLTLPSNYKMADTFYEQIRTNLEEMQKNLEENEQLLVYHYCPSGHPIFVTSIGFQNPAMIVLHGLDAMGNECCVLSHMTSIQLVVRVMQVEGEKKRRRIGFMHQPDSTEKK